MHRLLFLLLSCCLLSSCGAQPLAPSLEPKVSTVFTSTREVRALSWNAATNTLWAATAGGVLRFQNGTWTKWTRENGLPANETFDIAPDGTARFPTQSARFESNVWRGHAEKPFTKAPVQAQWDGTLVRATLAGLSLGSRLIPLPASSPGTHISALLARGSFLQVAVYGDGLWRFDGAKWTREPDGVPAEAREITALAGDEATLWLGTRREGIWKQEGKEWTHFVQSGEVGAHNVQFLARFRGKVFASTLDDGLMVRSGEAWSQVSTPTLSSSAPRQMIVWRDTLYVRHGTGTVDSFDGANWTKDALPSLPRRGVYALAGEGDRLLASGWGGWAEWNGRTWTPHYDVPQLKGVPILGVVAAGDAVYLLTQSRGVGLWNRASQSFRWFDERDSLPDDWITTMRKVGDHLYAGTFVGGLARLDGDRWFVFPELRGENVTSISALPQSGVLAATRHGLFAIEGDTAKKVELAWLDSEDQALLADEDGVWVGARTSLNFWRTNSMAAKE